MISRAASDKLIKLCGMLGSEYGGERANAAFLADHLLREHNLTWRDVLDPTKVHTRSWREVSEIHEKAAVCLLFPEAMTEWENKFTNDVFHRGPYFTGKQTTIINRLYDKCGAYARVSS